jgi:hypothetical protein
VLHQFRVRDRKCVVKSSYATKGDVVHN